MLDPLGGLGLEVGEPGAAPADGCQHPPVSIGLAQFLEQDARASSRRILPALPARRIRFVALEARWSHALRWSGYPPHAA